MRFLRTLALVIAAAVGVLAPSDSNVALAAADTTRVRKNWEQFTSSEQALYLDAVRVAMQTGKHLLFTKIYMDDGGLEHVRASCGAPAWYRKWLYGYETMLRSLDAKFAAVTLPYWNFFYDSAKRTSARHTCKNMQSCSLFLTAFGGSNGTDFAKPYMLNGTHIVGNCVTTGIAQYGCTDASGSANCEQCIPRGDWDIAQSTFEFGTSALPEVLRHATKSATPLETLRESMQTRFHWNLHNLLGGVYETRAAAFDPIFVGHYAMVDLIYHLYQGCSLDTPLTSSCTTADGIAINASATIPMLLDGTPVDDHASTASYFADVGRLYSDLEHASSYEIDPFVEILLREFALGCSRDSASTLKWATADRLVDLNVTAGFAHAMAVCGNSTLSGSTTDEAPYTAVTCELMARAQNGVFTNFSTPIRQTFRAPAHLLPSCIDVLAALATDTIQLRIADECKAAIFKETGESTNDFVAKTNGFAVVTRGRDGGVKYLKGSKARATAATQQPTATSTPPLT